MFRYILVGLAGIVLGAYLNYRVNKVTNEDLLNALKAHLDAYLKESENKRIAPEQQQIINSLQQTINFLSNK